MNQTRIDGRADVMESDVEQLCIVLIDCMNHLPTDMSDECFPILSNYLDGVEPTTEQRKLLIRAYHQLQLPPEEGGRSVIGFGNIVNALRIMKGKGRLPKLRFLYEFSEVQILENEPYSADYIIRGKGGGTYGRVTPLGIYVGLREGMIRVLTELASDIEGSAAAFGYATGSCAICGRELTKKSSIAAGIGPACLERLRQSPRASSSVAIASAAS